MEHFELRGKATKNGCRLELWLVGHGPGGATDPRRLAGCSDAGACYWLRQSVEQKLAGGLSDLGGGDVRLDGEAGMRLALAFVEARRTHRLVTVGGYVSDRQRGLRANFEAARRRFGEQLLALPSEVVLYWFTLCYYGRRTQAGRKALRALLATGDDR